MKNEPYLSMRSHAMVAGFYAITNDLDTAKQCAKLAVQDILGVRPNVPYTHSSTQYEEAEEFWKAMPEAIDRVQDPDPMAWQVGYLNGEGK
jgi:CRISPR/Cas system CSM-associated protein Csm2 small subunit